MLDVCSASLTSEAVKATFDALDVVHEFGILYGNIQCNNILVIKGGVCFIDFGFSHLIISGKDCKKERVELEYMLKYICRCQWHPSKVEKISQFSH